VSFKVKGILIALFARVTGNEKQGQTKLTSKAEERDNKAEKRDD
jgi:hypothetical protein